MGKLGAQLDPQHWGPHYEDLLRRWQPKSVRIINPDPERVRRVLAVTPNSLITLRDHPLSEQHADMMRDPVGTGRSHAESYARLFDRLQLSPSHPREQFAFTGINEPHIWEDGVPAAVSAYTLSFLKEMSGYGLRAGVLNFSVGWPDNGGTGTKPNWEPFRDVLTYLEENNQHWLMTHEYFCKDGPKLTADGKPDMDGGPWGWTVGRILQLDAGVNIIIGECGLEQFVCDSKVSFWQRGWKAHVDAETYGKQLREYESGIAGDGRIHSAQIFILDGSRDWASLYYDEQIPMLGQNHEFGFYADPSVPKPPPTGTDEEKWREAARANQTLSLNPDAALQKAISALGFWPVGNEVVVGSEVVQRAEDPVTGQGWTFHVTVGDWGNVESFPD